jgi:uroporphyrinogen-III decarboxylase
MSNKQYEEFWWPSMRQVMMDIIDAGFIPYLFSEGIYTERLPIIKDIPKGKAIYKIESDIFKAKEILGDTVCLTGGPPASLMNSGTPEEVKDYCKKLIDVVGEGGGFMMDPAIPLITAKVENVKALTEFTQEYGVYK